MKRIVGNAIVGFGVAVLGSWTATAAREQAAQAVRVIADRATGDRWLLVRDEAHPGGPGRMVRAEDPLAISVGGDPNPGAKLDASAAMNTSVPVIRAGDRVTVEEHTSIVDARFEAVALGSAELGSALSVELKIGGKVVRAVAIGPGRARFVPETTVKP